METIPPIQIFNVSGVDVPINEHDALFILKSIETHQDCQFESVELVYVPEDEIIRINQEYLNRDYVTDIISFRLDDEESNQSAIEGMLYCCAPRIREQAEEFNQSEENEFLRILIHGLIHLIGYDDQTEEEKKEMTRLEDYFLDAFHAR